MEQNILTPTQQKILLSAKRDHTITDQFYLTGGTALAHYYLNHRFSEDFDFFSRDEINEISLQTWAQKTARVTGATNLELQTLRGQLVFYFHFTSEVVKIDFAYFPFEHIGTFTVDELLKVSSIEDIGVNKLQALMSRKRGRDFVDLYTIIHKKDIRLSDLIKDYRIKFDMYVSPEEWAKHFAGILDASDQPRFLGEQNWKNIETYFL